MNNNKRISEIDELISSIKHINNNHHTELESLLSTIKKEDVDNSELSSIVKKLHTSTENYVVSVTQLVNGIKQASLKYFRRVIPKI